MVARKPPRRPESAVPMASDSPLMSSEKSVSPAILRASWFMASATSTTSPRSAAPCQEAASASVACSMVVAKPPSRRCWKAGWAMRRWRFQSAPSEVSRPLPRSCRSIS